MKVNIIKNGSFAYLNGNEAIKCKDNSHLKVGENSYPIKGSKLSVKTFPYKTIDDNIISTSIDAKNILMKGDIISINIPNYSIDTIMKIKKSPEGFKVGDYITYETENMVPSESPATFEVTAVTQKGKIKGLEMQSDGCFLRSPDVHIYKNESTGGKIVDLELDIIFNKLSSSEEAVIKDMKASATEVAIILNYSALPFNFEDTITIKKPVLWLSKIYTGNNVFEEKCEITSNFTPHLNMPMMSQNTPSHHVIFNECIEIIDSAFKRIENTLKELDRGK